MSFGATASRGCGEDEGDSDEVEPFLNLVTLEGIGTLSPPLLAVSLDFVLEAKEAGTDVVGDGALMTGCSDVSLRRGGSHLKK